MMRDETNIATAEADARPGLRVIAEAPALVADEPGSARALRVLVIDGTGELGAFATSLADDPSHWDLLAVAHDLDRGFHLAMAGRADVVLWTWVPGVARLLRTLDLLADVHERCLMVLVRPHLTDPHPEAIASQRSQHYPILAPAELSAERITQLWREKTEDLSTARRANPMRPIARRA